MIKYRKYSIGIGIVITLVAGYFIVDDILFDGFKPKTINENGFQADFYSTNLTQNKTAIILIGGGQWGHYWGEQFANKGFVGLSLPYIGNEGLPKLPEEIPLEYFERAIRWLQEQPEVNPDKIVVMGASRNAELALTIAATFPRLVNGVIAYAPSSVSWSNTVLPYNSDAIKPSWKYNGKDIPYIPMDKIFGKGAPTINTLEYWESGLKKNDYAELAAIKVEEIEGPILLLSGKDDKVWPSSLMADRIGKRLMEHSFNYSFENIQYEKAGHLISSNPESDSEQRTGNIKIDGKTYEFEYGGTSEGDKNGKQKAKIEVFQFIEKL